MTTETSILVLRTQSAVYEGYDSISIKVCIDVGRVLPTVNVDSSNETINVYHANLLHIPFNRAGIDNSITQR